MERFWQISDAPSHRQERIVPGGTMELVINLREDEFRIYRATAPGPCRRFSGAMVAGAYARPFVIDAQQHASVIGVHFRPGGAFPFLSVTADELEGRHVDLEALWGTGARELRERLCVAGEFTTRCRLLERALIEHAFRSMEHHYAVRYALGAFNDGAPDTTIRDVARKIGISQRQFIQVFAQEVGLTPKLFCRLRRFQRAFLSLHCCPAPDWSQLVLDGGYSDQSHFIRDFRDFSGLQPTEFLAQRDHRVKECHVPFLPR